MSITFFVEGIPVAQPRVKAEMRGKHVHIYTPNKKPKDARKMSIGQWKKAVERECLDVVLSQKSPGYECSPDAFLVSLSFLLPRPAFHFGTGKNSKLLKSSAPLRHTTKPDVDNLAKAVLDVITYSKVWDDDSQVFSLLIEKSYTVHVPGVFVTIKNCTLEKDAT